VDVVLEDFCFAPIVRVNLDLQRVEVVRELALPSVTQARADHPPAGEELEIAWHSQTTPQSKTAIINADAAMRLIGARHFSASSESDVSIPLPQPWAGAPHFKPLAQEKWGKRDVFAASA